MRYCRGFFATPIKALIDAPLIDRHGVTI